MTPRELATAGLLPCPFCGGKARTDLMPSNDCSGWIQCSSCEIHQDMRDTSEEVISRWNTRAPVNQSPHHEAVLDALDRITGMVEKTAVFFDSHYPKTAERLSDEARRARAVLTTARSTP